MNTKRTSIIFTISKDELNDIVINSNTYRDILVSMGFSRTGGNHNRLKERLQQDKIDTSHIDNYVRKTSANFHFNPLSNDEFFVENSQSGQSAVRNRVIKHGLIEYVCSECGQKDWHNGKPLSLQLDHINGINNDNRLENLRFLCPNCHTQTSTFGSKRRKKKQKKCSRCGKVIGLNTKTDFCRKCYDNRNKMV